MNKLCCRFIWYAPLCNCKWHLMPRISGFLFFKAFNEKQHRQKESLRAWKVWNFIKGYILLMAVLLLGARMPDFASFPPIAHIAAPDIQGRGRSLLKCPQVYWGFSGKFYPFLLWELEAWCDIWATTIHTWVVDGWKKHMTQDKKVQHCLQCS